MIVIEAFPCRYCDGYFALEEFSNNPEHDGKFALPNYCPGCGEGAVYWESDVTYQFRVIR